MHSSYKLRALTHLSVVKYGVILSIFYPKKHPVMLYTPVFECGSRGYIFSAIESHYRIKIFEVTQKYACMLIERACCLSSSITREIKLRFLWGFGYALSYVKSCLVAMELAYLLDAN